MASSAPAPPGTLDFVRCIRAVTDDPEWIRKVLIGGGFVLLSGFLVGLPFVLGYYARVMRRAAAGEERPLPEWSDFGGLLEEGVRLLVVYLGHLLGVFAVAAALGCVLMLPALLLGALSRDGDAAGRTAAALGGLGMFAAYGLMMLLSLALAVYLPAALAGAALRGTIGAGFDWRRILAFVRANPGNYLLALVVYLVSGLVAQVGFLLCCIGVFPAVFWSHATGAVAIGEAVRLSPDPL